MATYRKPKEPFVVGEMRVKSWRILEPNVQDTDRRWRRRCQQYWTLQSRLYGVELSPLAMLVDNTNGAVSTYSTVLEILPGERTADYSLVPIESAQVESVR